MTIEEKINEVSFFDAKPGTSRFFLIFGTLLISLVFVTLEFSFFLIPSHFQQRLNILFQGDGT